MATTLTRNLKLRINSNLTADAKYNLERLDLLGSTFLVDTTNNLQLRSQTNVLIQPNSADIGGSGIGGNVVIGAAGQPVANFTVYADNISFGSNLSLEDQAVGGNKKLRLKYKSDINGSVDTAADRNLFIDTDGADRNLVLAGNLSLLGGFQLAITASANSSITVPQSGTLSTLAGAESLTNKSIDASNNTISNISNGSIANAAAIAYSKLNLSNNITNSDINSSAAISYSKINLTSSIVNADVANGAAIAYSKLNLTGSITNSDIAANASIAGSKISANFGNQLIISQNRIQFQTGGYNTELGPATGGQSANLYFKLPNTYGSNGQVLQSNGSGELSWVSVGGTGTVTSVDLTMPAEFSVSGNPITGAGTLSVSKADQSANTIYAGPTSGGAASPSFRTLVAADLPAGVLTGVSDTSSVDLTVTGTTLSADVIPGGVNHDALLNFAANEHIDHSAVQIATSATSGLSGGGDLTTTRNITVAPNLATSTTVDSLDEILVADVSNSNALRKVTAQSIADLAGSGVSSFLANWITADGTTKVVTHSLGTTDVVVSIIDLSNNQVIYVDTITVTDANTVTLVSSQAPASTFRVIIQGF